MRYLLFLFTLVWHLPAAAQLSTVLPEKPVAGEEIKVIYDPTHEKASLKGGAAIYARITNYEQDGGVIKKYVLLTMQNGVYAQQYRLPASAASVKVEFYNLNKDDAAASHHLLVYTTDRQRPVQGAYQDALFSNNPDSIFQLEVANYPQNYLAYARYINILAMIKESADAKKQLQELLAHLQKEGKVKNAGLLAAFCIGHAKMGALAEGRKYLFTLLEQCPDAEETAFAFSIYNYEYYKASTRDVEEAVRQKLKAVFVKHPAAPISRDENVFHCLEKEPDLTVADFERVLLPMYQDSTVSYHALTNLPEIYMAKGKPAQAKPFLQQGIQLFQDGRINHQYRLGYGHYQTFVPILLMDLVKINLLEKDLQAAIINSSAAISILSGSNVEGNFVPLLLPLRAQAYQLSGNVNLALEDYKLLYRMGTVGALDSIRNLFPQCNVRQKTVEELITTLKAPASKQTPAPELTAYDLQGKAVHLSDLKGKLVVINIWSTGCGPCVAEMPELNKLVQQFPDRDKVVFLGIADDTTEKLKKFLQTHPYNYMVLNKVANLSEKFNTDAWPVHILVGKQGEVISRSVGARADIREYLARLIEKNL